MLLLGQEVTGCGSPLRNHEVLLPLFKVPLLFKGESNTVLPTLDLNEVFEALTILVDTSTASVFGV